MHREKVITGYDVRLSIRQHFTNKEDSERFVARLSEVLSTEEGAEVELAVNVLTQEVATRENEK